MRILPRERGEVYWSKRAKENGIKGSTYRMRRARGWSPEKAATKPVKPTTAVLPNPESMAQVSLRFGLRINAIGDWRARNKGSTLSNEEIAHIISEGKKRVEKAKAFNARCRAKGLVPRTVKEWMHRYSMTEEQALARKPTSRRELGKRNAEKRRVSCT